MHARDTHASRQEKTVEPAVVPRRIPSEELLGRAGQTVIVHRGREYRLRQTQSGKLILTA
jgi:hemin uptake protein HemP